MSKEQKNPKKPEHDATEQKKHNAKSELSKGELSHAKGSSGSPSASQGLKKEPHQGKDKFGNHGK